MSGVSDLTDVQRETLEYLKSYKADHGYAPTHQEIADRFRIRKRAVADRLSILDDKAVIRLVPGMTHATIDLPRLRSRVRTSFPAPISLTSRTSTPANIRQCDEIVPANYASAIAPNRSIRPFKKLMIGELNDELASH